MRSSTRQILGVLFWLTGLATTYFFAYQIQTPYYFALFAAAFIVTETNQIPHQSKFEKWYYLVAIVLTGIGFTGAIAPVIEEMILLLLTNIVFMLGATMLFAYRVRYLTVDKNDETESSAQGV